MPIELDRIICHVDTCYIVAAVIMRFGAF